MLLVRLSGYALGSLWATVLGDGVGLSVGLSVGDAVGLSVGLSVGLR